MFDTQFTPTDPAALMVKLFEEDPSGVQLDFLAQNLREIIEIDGVFDTIFIKHEESDTDEPGDLNAFIKLRWDLSQETTTLPLSAASSGYRAILSLICDIFAGVTEHYACHIQDVPNKAFVVLIDEIEAHLHPRWKMQIVQRLRRTFPRATFIISSHDPLCIRGMCSREVVTLVRRLKDEDDQTEDGTEQAYRLAEVVEPLDEFSHLENMTVEQILTSDAFSLVNVDDPDRELELAYIAEGQAKPRPSPYEAASELVPDNMPQSERAQFIERRAKLEQDARHEAHSAVASLDFPLGSSETQHLLIEALEDYLRISVVATKSEKQQARNETKQAIIGLLKTELGN